MDSQSVCHSRAFLIGVLGVAALLVYAGSLQNQFVEWDDDSLVTKNPLTQHMTAETVYGAFTSYDPELYVPLTIVSFQIEHAVFGFKPFMYHLDNLLLHIIVSSLVLLLLERLGLRRGTAFLGAILFAIHPLNTEAVAWVSARKDLLSTLFSLCAILSYLQHKTSQLRQWDWRTFVLVLLAMLCKPVSIMVPFVFLLIDWKEDGRITKRDVIKKLPLFALSAFFVVIGLIGKHRNIGALTFYQTVLLGIKSTVFSLQKFLWPTSLSSLYLQTDPISIRLVQFWIPLLLCGIVGISLLIVVQRLRSSPHRSLTAGGIFVIGTLWYLLFLLPSFSNFAKDHSIYFFSDRYVYLSQVGLLFAIGWCLDYVQKKIVWIIGTPLLCLLAWQAHAQSLVWKDSETLYRDALRKNERSAVMHYDIGLIEQKRGHAALAREEYNTTLMIDPRYAKALTNLGMLERDAGNIAHALELLHQATVAEPRSPEPHNNIGSILMDRGDTDGAIAEFQAAITLRPDFAQAHINLASALGRKELYAEGLEEYRKAFSLDPELRAQLPEIQKALESLP